MITNTEGTGALIRRRPNGIYCRANAGVIRSLPLRKAHEAESPPLPNSSAGCPE